MDETGAATTKIQSYQDILLKGIAIGVPVDVRIGLALTAQNCYCSDGSGEPFSLPGYEMVDKAELVELLSSADNPIDPESVTVVEQTFDKIGNKEIPVLAHKRVNKLPKNTYFFDHFPVQDPKTGEMVCDADVKIWLQNVKIDDKTRCGIMGPTGFRAAIYKRKPNEQYTKDVDTSRLPLHIPAEGLFPEYIFACVGSDNITKIFNFDERANSFCDWINANINQGVGFHFCYSKQYKIAYALGVHFARKFGDLKSNNKMMVVGHSLGGGLASAFSVGASCYAMTFNAAGLHKELLAKYMAYPHTRGIADRFDRSIKAFVGRNSTEYRAICEQEKNVQNYSSTTDFLTNWINNNTGEWSLFSRLVLFSLGSIIATPIMGARACMAPTTFGNHTYVRTKSSAKAELSANNIKTKKRMYDMSKGKDLVWCSEFIGHDMSMLIDGLINAIHDINNVGVTFQAMKDRYKLLLQQTFCCGVNSKYSPGKTCAHKGGCKQICMWLSVKAYRGKCVYTPLKGSIDTGQGDKPTKTEGDEYRITSAKLDNNAPRNMAIEEINAMEITKKEFEAIVDSLRFHGLEGKDPKNLHNPLNPKKIDAPIKKKTSDLESRLMEFGKDNHYQP